MEAESPKAKVVQPSEGLQYNVMGAIMTYKTTAQDTRGAYSLAIEVTPPHGGLPLHVHHQEDEAMYVLKGEYEIQCGDQAFRATDEARRICRKSWRLPASTGLNLFLPAMVRLGEKLVWDLHRH